MNKHSPGPWSFEVEENGDKFKLSDVNNEVVVGGCGCCDSPWCNLADARLIAAAPDLLEALKVVLDDLMYKHHARVIDVAHAAIAKAEGKI